MNIFLEIAASLSGAYRCQVFHGRFQKVGDVILHLFAQSGIFQFREEVRLINVGKSAAERTLGEFGGPGAAQHQLRPHSRIKRLDGVLDSDKGRGRM